VEGNPTRPPISGDLSNATTIATTETIQVDITGATELQLPENELTFKGDILPDTKY